MSKAREEELQKEIDRLQARLSQEAKSAERERAENRRVLENLQNTIMRKTVAPGDTMADLVKHGLDYDRLNFTVEGRGPTITDAREDATQQAAAHMPSGYKPMSVRVQDATALYDFVYNTETKRTDRKVYAWNVTLWVDVERSICDD